MFISLGPKYVEAGEGTIRWYHIDSDHPDEWDFYNPQILENDLYILCHPTFGTSFTLSSNGFGYASIDDTFENKVPLTLLDPDLNSFPENKAIKAGEPFEFYIKIPMKNLGTERPTFLACEIYIELNGRQDKIELFFTVSW